MLALVDRLFGGRGPKVIIDDPGGGWQW